MTHSAVTGATVHCRVHDDMFSSVLCQLPTILQEWGEAEREREREREREGKERELDVLSLKVRNRWRREDNKKKERCGRGVDCRTAHQS